MGLSVSVNPPSVVVALEPSRLTSGKLKLVFLQGVPYSLHHVVQAVGPPADRRDSSLQVWDGGVGPAPQMQDLFRARVWGKPSSCQYLVLNPTLSSNCPVLHGKCSKMNCGIWPWRGGCFLQTFCSSDFRRIIHISGIILLIFTPFICWCYSLVSLLTLQRTTSRITR